MAKKNDNRNEQKPDSGPDVPVLKSENSGQIQEVGRSAIQRHASDHGKKRG